MLPKVFGDTEDAQAVGLSIDEVTDLDGDHVVGQEEGLASAAHSGQRPPEPIKAPTDVSNNEDLAHVSLDTAITCRPAYCGKHHSGSLRS